MAANKDTRLEALRECTRCKTPKPLTEFGMATHSSDGINQWCKPCTRESAKAWRSNNRERHREYSNNWRANNIEKAKAGKRRAYYASAEQRRQYTREWRLRNYEYATAKERQYALEHAERGRRKAKEWRESHLERAKASAKRWRKANPEACRAASAQTKAKRKAAPGRYTGEDVKRLFTAQRGKCGGCLRLLLKYHVDHIEPLAKGGTNWPWNLQLLCPECNLRKGAKTLEEWKAIVNSFPEREESGR